MDYNKKQLINGREASIIATYRDEELDKDFIMYTDGSKNEQGKLNIIYGIYKRKGENILVESIKNKEEEKLVLEVLKFVTKEAIPYKE